ncbi:MAG: NAD(+)/NADH kinase [Clostridiales bacterium]|nr:NAD(+)/NADH kinase [Clostridiales bacterium]
MKNVGIIANINKEGSLEYTGKIAQWLTERNISPFVSSEIAKRADFGCDFGDNRSVCEKSDTVIVLGGDGTILNAAQSAALYNVPLMGINLGTLGYLTDVEKGGWDKALNRLINGEYKTERRMMLEAFILNADKEYEPYGRLMALNDICILRSDLSRMIDAEIYVNGDYIDTYRADGIIVATPTGSTAYNLSAGGPILKPDIELIAITPICPHKIYSRSAVISASDLVCVDLSPDDGSAVLSLDGQRNIKLKAGQTVEIRKSALYTTIIKTSNMSFYDILREKFHNS